jgi:pimeloyl-ACP methyl ester carboxylesterase
MRRDELVDSGRVLGVALDEIAVLTRDVHRAVARAVFRRLGPVTTPVRLLHDPIAAVAYGSTRVGVRLLPPAAAAGAATNVAGTTPSVHDSPPGHFGVSVLSGFWGDRLVAQRPALAPVLRVCTHDGPLRADPANLADDAAATATSRLVVFVHGLCESDRYWWLGAARRWGDRDTTYGALLRDDDGWTPLYVSYNTGQHICDSGTALADYLEQLCRQWPVPVTEIALVGHSMGGLVTRSTSHQAVERSHAWVDALRHVVSLGAPHTGAPLERAVTRGTVRLSRSPVTRPFATWLNRRSVGIKDLRHGALVPADWPTSDSCIDDTCTEVALLPGVAYSCVSATLGRTDTAWPAHDLLVQHRSAIGIGAHRTIAFDAERRLHVGGRTHFHLLNDPDVYSALRGWLAAR